MLDPKVSSLIVMLDSRLRSDSNTEPTKLRSSGHTKLMCLGLKTMQDPGVLGLTVILDPSDCLSLTNISDPSLLGSRNMSDPCLLQQQQQQQ